MFIKSSKIVIHCAFSLLLLTVCNAKKEQQQQQRNQQGKFTKKLVNNSDTFTRIQ